MATMTAAQRREQDKAAFNAYLDACPTAALRGLLGNKWNSLILMELRQGTRRYAALGRALPSASAKMLTQTLRALERDGFVERAVTPSVPVQVEYALTPLGERLCSLLDHVREWADANFDDVQAARVRYDLTG